MRSAYLRNLPVIGELNDSGRKLLLEKRLKVQTPSIITLDNAFSDVNTHKIIEISQYGDVSKYRKELDWERDNKFGNNPKEQEGLLDLRTAIPVYAVGLVNGFDSFACGLAFVYNALSDAEGNFAIKPGSKLNVISEKDLFCYKPLR